MRDPDAYDLVVLPKVRAVDPPVWIDGDVKPLSALDPDFAQYRADYVTDKTGQWFLRIV